jgi:hypothetical protein
MTDPDPLMTTTTSFTTPKGVWLWDVFGGGLLNVTLHEGVSAPLWRRVLTRICLGSKWKRL